jgi:peptidoglycan/LPS O-acetylase OafA/YrhL
MSATRSQEALGRSLSTHLDVLRVGAALVVFVSHVALPRLTGGLLPVQSCVRAADDAVMVFFVLSGFVISHAAAARDGTLGDFAAARLARLYSVVLPALVLTLAADTVGRHLAPDLYAGWWHGSHPVLRIATSLGFLNELWFESVKPFSNGPFWSIAYEAWYYAIFGLAFYLPSPWRWITAALACVVAGPKIVILFPLWLAGAAVREYRNRVPETLGWALMVGSVVGYVVYQVSGAGAFLYWWQDQTVVQLVGDGFSRHVPSKVVVGAFTACHLLGFGAIQRRVSLAAIARPVRWLAGMMFALYLFHYPLLHMATSLWPEPLASPVRAVVLAAAVFGTIALLASVTERRKEVARRAVDAAFAAFGVLARRLRTA